MQRVQLQACYILHHRPMRETSVIADVMTPDHGRVSVIARGARSPKSSTRILLQPFRPLLISWTGRGDLKTLTGLEEQGKAITVHGLRMACAYYLNELVLRLVPTFSYVPEVFALYSATLGELPQVAEIEPHLRHFELDLLDALGLLPDFQACVNGYDTPVESLNYLYHPESGHAHIRGTAAGSLDQSRLSKPAANTVQVSGEALQALTRRDLSNRRLWPEIKRLMRWQLRVHIGGAPLKSREMLAHYATGTHDGSRHANPSSESSGPSND